MSLEDKNDKEQKVVDFKVTEKEKEIAELRARLEEFESEERKLHYEREYEHFKNKAEKKSDSIKTTVIGCIFLLCLFLLYFVSINNPKIFKIENETMTFISQGFNAIMLLMSWQMLIQNTYQRMKKTNRNVFLGPPSPFLFGFIVVIIALAKTMNGA